MRASTTNKRQFLKDSITRSRLYRLQRNSSILGEPDVISVNITKTISTLFNKSKKSEEYSEFFINGIIFPTTAHFSTYVSSKYQISEKNASLMIKAKLLMFDVTRLRKKDIHVEINIPGSLEIKSYNMSGQVLPATGKDYERAFYCAYLRVLYPMNYPTISLNSYTSKVETHKQILSKLIEFTFQKQYLNLEYFYSSLRQTPGSQDLRLVYTSQLEEQYLGNVALQLILHFVLSSNHENLTEFVFGLIKKLSSKYHLQKLDYLSYQIKFHQRKYKRILHYSAEQLMVNSDLNFWKELQIKCLNELKSYNYIKRISENLLRQGGTHTEIYYLICNAHLQTKEYKKFLKEMNTVMSLYNEEQVYVGEAISLTKRLYYMDISLNKGRNISAYPELCFELGNSFLNRQNRLNNLFKTYYAQQAEGSLTDNRLMKGDSMEYLMQLMSRLNKSLNDPEETGSNSKTNLFSSLLIKLEKIKGWNELIKIRGECFWLDTDFKNQEDQILERSFTSLSTINQNSSSSNKKSFQRQVSVESRRSGRSVSVSASKGKKSSVSAQQSLKEKPKTTKQLQGHRKSSQIQRVELHEIEFNEQQSFEEGNFSEQEDEDQLDHMPACSKRVNHNANTTRKRLSRKVNSLTENQELDAKVLCCMGFQTMFMDLYSDLKLQVDTDKWAERLNIGKIQAEMDASKRQIYAILFIKKAFLHKKLLRFKKCEQALRIARRISSSALVQLVSSHELIHLYIESNNMKGVEHYIFELIKIFVDVGIDRFDIVPEWAKPIIGYIIQKQGLEILKRISGPLKELVIRWARNDYTEEEISRISAKSMVSMK